MKDEWEDVEVPQGAYIGWGEIGQSVTLEVVSYGDASGTDQNGNPCPQLVGTLVMDAVNYRDKGTRKETLEKGEFVTITCSQASLKRTLMATHPAPVAGNLMRITYESDYKGQKGTGKAFKVQMNRTARGVAADELV